ncbi:hypothetical protein [Terrisporobacter petrolearius]|uniref:hypothetical protein n=1 Tax=Terrisporobacter petrolearius TaxID=1460447 RepID=UPI0031CC6D12
MMKIKKVRRYKKEKKETDKLMELLKGYKESQVPYVQKMYKLISVDELYLERLEGNFNNYGGLYCYDSFEEYVNNLVVPYLNKNKIRIGDLR